MGVEISEVSGDGEWNNYKDYRVGNSTSDGLSNGCSNSTSSDGLSNATSGCFTSPEEHCMSQLFKGYRVTLLVICVTGLVLGLPVVFGMLWHLRIATNASGRGVLR